MWSVTVVDAKLNSGCLLSRTRSTEIKYRNWSIHAIPFIVFIMQRVNTHRHRRRAAEASEKWVGGVAAVDVAGAMRVGPSAGVGPDDVDDL